MKISTTRLLITSAVLALSISSSGVGALGQSDLDSIYNDTVWYDGGTTSQCLPGNLTPGQGAPDGAQFPNLDPNAMASAIDKWISKENSNSALGGLGSTIVAGAKNSNVNPFLIVAIAKKESSLADPSDYNVKNGNNAFGRTATDDQPNFQGSKLWYKWTSVKASVDYAAPENQGAKGGGDIASYLRYQYGDQIDNNNLIALFLTYAPPGENDTEQYIAQVKQWISEMIELATGQPYEGGNSNIGCGGGVTSCTSESSTAIGPNAEILCEAKRYDGIWYLFGGGHMSYTAWRQQCPLSALVTAAAASTESNPGPCATDCSSVVTHSVNAAYNQSYFSWTVSSGGVMQGGGAQFWKEIPISSAQAGDIVTRPSSTGHVEIVEQVNGGSITTFGSRQTGTKTGSTTNPTSTWSNAWRWTGPGGEV